MQRDAAKEEELAGDKDPPTADAVIDLKMSHRTFATMQRDLHGPPMSVLKLEDLG